MRRLRIHDRDEPIRRLRQRRALEMVDPLEFTWDLVVTTLQDNDRRIAELKETVDNLLINLPISSPPSTSSNQVEEPVTPPTRPQLTEPPPIRPIPINLDDHDSEADTEDESEQQRTLDPPLDDLHFPKEFQKPCIVCGGGDEVQNPWVKYWTCNHIFHRECLQRWVRVKGDDVSCPYCRNGVRAYPIILMQTSPIDVIEPEGGLLTSTE